jgi:hypothetical protein
MVGQIAANVLQIADVGVLEHEISNKDEAANIGNVLLAAALLSE